MSLPPAQPASEEYPHWKDDHSQQEDGFDNWITNVNLKKGDEFRINPEIAAVRMGLGWDVGHEEADVDASAALLNAQGERTDGVHYKKLKTRCGSVIHSGDNYTGEGEGDDEVILVEFATLSPEVHHIILVAAVFSQDVTFEQVERAYVRMSFGKEPTKDDELCKLSLTEMNGDAVVMGQITRKGAYWWFKALGIAVCGKDLKAVLQTDKVKQCVSSFPSFDPVSRHIVVDVLKGRELAAKNSGMLGLRNASSDPYPAFKFKGIEDRLRKPQNSTLDPVWEPQEFDMGSILESESAPLEISIFDSNKVFSDTFMGMIAVPGRQLYQLGPGEHTFWFTLAQSKDKKYEKQNVSGEILVRFKITE